MIKEDEMLRKPHLHIPFLPALAHDNDILLDKNYKVHA